ncbi:hypothetical protein BXZ70DRAFT_186945 [Cristinia sonorae]|uniref:DUF6593 domain-containing protein n=1 Tax=Cristinia sonorae TaxID=1940300 RepID=A0A8K0UQA3_9AGAR|nr:hypothetical protein BXZ70DRAFT_186945 [Cristinia sonorae]
MDTQLTLVDMTAPLPQREARTVLLFSRDSLMNTTLRIRGTQSTVYVVKTNFKSTRTTVSRMIPGSDQGAVEVARIDRNDIFPDKVTFEGFPSMKLNSWLKKQSFTDPAQSKADSPKKYVWKPTNLREIALYEEDMPLRPIAWFRASAPDESASLSLQSEAEVIQDAVLTSLIIVEQRYRVESKWARVGDGVGQLIAQPLHAATM